VSAAGPRRGRAIGEQLSIFGELSPNPPQARQPAKAKTALGRKRGITGLGVDTINGPAAWWDCPCSSGPHNPDGPKHRLTMVSIREPECPFCGFPFAREFERDASTAMLVLRESV
jgi:hypothetical protein